MEVTFGWLYKALQLRHAKKMVHTYNKCIHPWQPNISLSSSALSTQKSGIEITFIHEPSAAGLLPIDTMPHEEIRAWPPQIKNKVMSDEPEHKIEAISFATFSKAVIPVVLFVSANQSFKLINTRLPVYQYISPKHKRNSVL